MLLFRASESGPSEPQCKWNERLFIFSLLIGLNIKAISDTMGVICGHWQGEKGLEIASHRRKVLENSKFDIRFRLVTPSKNTKQIKELN